MENWISKCTEMNFENMDQRRNIKTNLKNILNKWKWKHTCQNFGDTTRAVPIGKYMAVKAFITTEEKSKINHLNFHLRKPEREEQSKAK